MLWAGFWQLGRADEKASINNKLAQQKINQPQTETQWMQLSAFDSVEIKGQYLDIHFILNNQIIDGQVGHFIFTAFRTHAGPWLLVNRGWVKEVPISLGLTEKNETIKGLVADWPRPGVQLGEQIIKNERIQQVTYLPMNAVHNMLKDRLCYELETSQCVILSYVLKLDPLMEQGFVRQWQLPRMTAEKHRAYAVQWFTMSLVLCLIYGVFLRKIYLS